MSSKKKPMKEIIDSKNPWEGMIGSGKYGLTECDPLVRAKADGFKRNGMRTILDLGSGLGRHTGHLKSEGLSCFGLDISTSAVEKSARNFELTRGCLMIGDMKGLPFGDDTFDAVLAWRVLYLEKKEGIRKALEEIRRVLKGGGEIYASIRSVNNTIFHLGKSGGRELEENTFTFDQGPLKGTVYHFFTEDEVRDEFGEFETIELLEQELEHTPYTADHPEYKNMFWIYHGSLLK
jgi:SAM-dependent methyltransferase